MAKKNEGKRFEEDIEKSVPAEWFVYRLKDSSASWSHEEGKSRFTPKNMCDFLIFDTTWLDLYGIECKSFKGKSMNYSLLNDKNGKKLKKLCDMPERHNCIGGYLLNFRDLDETYFVDARCLDFLKKNGNRKSISIDQAKEHGKLIPQTKKKVRFRYDLEVL